MSEVSIVFGRIHCYSDVGMKKNIELVSKLPSSNISVPYFTSEMFNRSMSSAKAEYVLGFARIYKNIEHSWKEWIEEFEALIINMEWESISVMLETEMFGTHQYFWKRKNQEERLEGFIEKENWYFGGGHRNFWGMEEHFYGWKNDVDEIRTLKIFDSCFEKTKSKEESILNLIPLKNSPQEFEIQANRNGLKNFIHNLIKFYINESQEVTNIESYNKIKILIKSLFSESSEFNITSLKLNDDPNDTDWVNHFVDKMIDLKK